MQNPILFLSIIRIGFFQKLFYTQSVNKKPIPYLIAVDGGGTGCRVVIARPEGGILASAEAGPANIATAFGTALQTIIQTANATSRQASSFMPSGAGKNRSSTVNTGPAIRAIRRFFETDSSGPGPSPRPKVAYSFSTTAWPS